MYLEKNLTLDTTYPNLTQNIRLSFDIDTFGRATNIKIEPKHELLKSDILKLENLCKNMPPWTPASLNGRKLKQHIEIPIHISFED